MGREINIYSERMEAAVQVRRARAEDAETIAAVLFASFVEFRPLYTDGGFAATALPAEQVHARLREGPVWVAERDGIVIGTVAAVKKGDSAYIRGMAVTPEARGSGAGEKLLQQAERWAGEEGFGRVFLSTTPFLHGAIRLYERNHYRRVASGEHDLFGTPLFEMEKVL